MLPGRTENAVKIRHKSLLRAAAKRLKKASEQKRLNAARKKEEGRQKAKAKKKGAKSKVSNAGARKSTAMPDRSRTSLGGRSSFNMDLEGEPLFVGAEGEEFIFDGEGQSRNSWDIGERRSWDDMFSMPEIAEDERLRRLSMHSIMSPRNSLESEGASMHVEEETVTLRENFIIPGDNGKLETENFDIEEVFNDD